MTKVRRVALAPFANGAELALSIHEVKGNQGDGPTLGISAAIHGDEPTGTHTVMEIARRHGEGGFRGRLLLLPVANPLAFEANRRCTPLDSQNLNRVFPGNPGGWFTEQLADRIKTEFLENIDAYIDLHSGTDRPTVDYVFIHNAEALSRSFGSRILFRAEDGKGGSAFKASTKSVTMALGVPSVTVELGGGLIDQTPYVARSVAGIENIMRKLGMLDGDPVPPPAQIAVHSIAYIRPTKGGFLVTEAPPLGEEINGSAVLGRVVSPYTFAELEVIHSPFERGIMILAHLTTNLVQPGDFGYMVGDMEGCQHLDGA
ncbi:MAG: M14 family metallopeptidase [Rhodospirillales bacterium]|jgi:hypothetical protein|nr:M14 family metallopeptidase [Rhodospirillales bacterium]MDP6788802.1 M14 family metallopeptidase [Rhodospirillales bacterium]